MHFKTKKIGKPLKEEEERDEDEVTKDEDEMVNDDDDSDYGIYSRHAWSLQV